MRPAAHVAAALLLGLLLAGAAAAQTNRIDTILPTAPELAAFGPMPIGVRTVTVTDRARVDVLNTKAGGPVARYDRALTLEIWYPAALPAGGRPAGEYHVITRDPSRTAVVRGRAVRDAAPLSTATAYPLVIVSHGYPGNRFLMSHLGENLASKGFVVASIDHRESTYDDQKDFASTLYHRPYDQLFVLDEMERLGRAGSGSFLAGLVDARRTGLVGYSMGGYGVLNVIGGGWSEAAVTARGAPPNRLLAERAAANQAYRRARDPRIKAALTVGPWGMNTGKWDAAGLAGIRTPTLIMAGSVDSVAGYEKGPRAVFEQAVNADRYLLTFVNAGHNAAAPMPAPAETYAYSEALRSAPFLHYADPVWDTVVMNNVFQHFATAWFDLHLKGDASKGSYLALVPNGKDGVWTTDREGRPQAGHTYWKGFGRGTAVGLVLEHAVAATAGR